MHRPARVAIVQSAHDTDDPVENLRRMSAAVENLRDRDLIVFPELAVQGHVLAAEPPGEMRRVLRATPSDAVEEFHSLVGTLGTRVVFGELVDAGGRLLNLATYTDGTVRVSYAKTHVHWTETFQPGSAFPVVETGVGSLGMLICFDAAFPEVPRVLALKGATMIVNISAIPDHFPLRIVHRRLQAASLDNQVFTIFANRRGPGFMGGSAVVDPTGEILAVARPDEAVLDVTIDLEAVDEWRRREPLFVHRRPDLYDAITERIPHPQLTEPVGSDGSHRHHSGLVDHGIVTHRGTHNT